MRAVLRFIKCINFELLAVVLVVMPFQGAILSIAAAAESGTWVDGDMPRLVVGDKRESLATETCYPEVFEYLSYTNPNGTYNSLGRKVQVNVCASQTGFGSIGGSTQLYVKPGTSTAFRVVGGDVSPIPNQKTFYYAQPAPNRSGPGSYLLFYDSFAQAGTFEPYNNELVYKFGLIDPSTYLRDGAGNKIVKLPPVAFSNNGDWMVILAEGLGFLRINSHTRQALLFDTQTYRYDLGTLPNITLAISDDGNTVIRSGIGAGSAKVFDLSGCQPATFVIGAANTTVGCVGRDVQDSLVSQQAGFEGLGEMKFVDGNKGVRGVVAIKNGIREYYNMTYSLAGYQAPHVNYLALGDSFSSGEGDPDDSNYEPGTNESGNKCHLSKSSYPYLTSQALGVDFNSVACSGAKYDPDYAVRPQHKDPLAPAWLPGSKRQADFVADSSPNVVTISMIGNDIGFSDKIKVCIAGVESCFHFKENRQLVADEIYSKYPRLFNLYTDIKLKAAPSAKIYVLGYPQLFSTNTTCDRNVFLDLEEREMSRGLVTYLNSVIKAATIKAGVQYIDVEDAFAGHEHCDQGEKAISGLVSGNDIAGILGNESFHPNPYGHKLMERSLLVQSEDFTKTMPTALPGTAAPYLGSVPYDNFIGSAPTLGSGYQVGKYLAVEAVKYVYKGGKAILNPQEVALKASSPFDAVFHSEPTYAGTIYTDASGNLNGEITVPTSLEPGFHTLHLYGQDVAGQTIDLYQTVYVAANESDVDGDGIPNFEEKCLAVDPANVDQDNDGVDDACDAAIPEDAASPIVSGATDRQPNEAGWYNGDVNITWNSADPEPSSGTPTQPTSTIADQEGVRIYTSDQSCDPQNNCAAGRLELKIDKTAPKLGSPTWSNNPKSTTGIATIDVPTSDNVSGVTEAEYYLGDVDPGEGNGATMQSNSNSISVSFNADFPTGVYKVTVRAKDLAGNWSLPISDYLVVYDPFGVRMTGQRKLRPSLANGDSLPGLVRSDQADKARFGFNVRYDKDGHIHRSSDFQFKYETGTKCNRLDQAVNCHELELNATSISWLTTQGQNDSMGIFQGTARLEMDGAVSNVVFRVVGVDGELLDPTSQDHLSLRVYYVGANLNTDNPLFQVNDEVLRGNVKIRKP